MAASGRGSRQKGKVGELDIVHAFQDAGFPEAHRNTIDGQVDGDIAKVPDYTEVRRRETLAIPAWVRECEERCPEGRDWALVFRRSREPWTVCISLDHYLRLKRG